MIDKSLLRNEDGKPVSGMGTLGKWKFLRQFHLKIERWSNKKHWYLEFTFTKLGKTIFEAIGEHFGWSY